MISFVLTRWSGQVVINCSVPVSQRGRSQSRWYCTPSSSILMPSSFALTEAMGVRSEDGDSGVADDINSSLGTARRVLTIAAIDGTIRVSLDTGGVSITFGLANFDAV